MSQMSFPGHYRRFQRTMSLVLMVYAVAFCLLVCGCVPLSTGVAESQPPAPGSESYKVIFVTDSGNEPEIYTGYFTEPITMQRALIESGAIKRYKGMIIDVARRVESTGNVIKLPVTFDHTSGRVMKEQNYAVHGGDEIRIQKNNPGVMDGFFRTLQGAGIERR